MSITNFPSNNQNFINYALSKAMSLPLFPSMCVDLSFLHGNGTKLHMVWCHPFLVLSVRCGFFRWCAFHSYLEYF